MSLGVSPTGQDASLHSAGELARHPLGWIATGMGAGLSPLAPGTVGSVVALLPWLGLSMLPPAVYLLVLAATFLVGVRASDWVIARTGIEDPGVVVIDEWLGLWVTLFLVPAGWAAAILGLLLFRFFDILKPWPIGWAERHFPGGVGVMLDDVLAGLCAWLVLRSIL